MKEILALTPDSIAPKIKNKTFPKLKRKKSKLSQKRLKLLKVVPNQKPKLRT